MLERLDEATAFLGGGEWYRRVGNAMERGALSSELDGNAAKRRAIWNVEDPRFLGTVFTLHRLQYSILLLSVPLCCCRQYGNISYDFCTCFGNPRVASPTLETVSEGGLCELVHCGRCLFGEGGIAYNSR